MFIYDTICELSPMCNGDHFTWYTGCMVVRASYRVTSRTTVSSTYNGYLNIGLQYQADHQQLVKKSSSTSEFGKSFLTITLKCRNYAVNMRNKGATKDVDKFQKYNMHFPKFHIQKKRADKAHEESLSKFHSAEE